MERSSQAGGVPAAAPARTGTFAGPNPGGGGWGRRHGHPVRRARDRGIPAGKQRG